MDTRDMTYRLLLREPALGYSIVGVSLTFCHPFWCATFPVVLQPFSEGSLEALTQKSHQLARRLKFQLLARINLLYTAFEMTAGWIGF
jgi:hypothetical protein